MELERYAIPWDRLRGKKKKLLFFPGNTWRVYWNVADGTLDWCDLKFSAGLGDFASSSWNKSSKVPQKFLITEDLFKILYFHLQSEPLQ